MAVLHPKAGPRLILAKMAADNHCGQIVAIGLAARVATLDGHDKFCERVRIANSSE